MCESNQVESLASFAGGGGESGGFGLPRVKPEVQASGGRELEFRKSTNCVNKNLDRKKTGQVGKCEKVNFKEEGGGGGRVQQQQEGAEHVHEEEDRAAVNHRVSTGSVSTSTRREGSSTICLQQ